MSPQYCWPPKPSLDGAVPAPVTLDCSSFDIGRASRFMTGAAFPLVSVSFLFIYLRFLLSVAHDNAVHASALDASIYSTFVQDLIDPFWRVKILSALTMVSGRCAMTMRVIRSSRLALVP